MDMDTAIPGTFTALAMRPATVASTCGWAVEAVTIVATTVMGTGTTVADAGKAAMVAVAVDIMAADMAVEVTAVAMDIEQCLG